MQGFGSRATGASALLLLAALSALGSLGCAAPIPYEERRDTTMDVVPIFQSNRVRSMHVTYYLASIEQEDDTVTVDLDLTNGFGRFLGAVTAWFTLHGENGEAAYHAYPVGPMAPHATHRVIVKVKDVDFTVEDLEVGVQIAP